MLLCELIQNVRQLYQLSWLEALSGSAAAEECESRAAGLGEELNAPSEGRCLFLGMYDDLKPEIQTPSPDLCLILSLPVSRAPCLWLILV